LFILAANIASAEVCYGKYGCFSNDPPFDRGLLGFNRLPKSPEDLKTTFYLYTRTDRIGFTTLDDSSAIKLEESEYDGSKKTILIAHGWTGR